MKYFVLSIPFLACMFIISDLNDRLNKSIPKSEIEVAIKYAYELGVSECPPSMVCINDQIGLKRLSIKDIEDLI